MLSWIYDEYYESLAKVKTPGQDVHPDFIGKPTTLTTLIEDQIVWGLDYLSLAAKNAPVSLNFAVGNGSIDHQAWGPAPWQVDELPFKDPAYSHARAAFDIKVGADIGSQYAAAFSAGRFALGKRKASVLTAQRDAQYAKDADNCWEFAFGKGDGPSGDPARMQKYDKDFKPGSAEALASSLFYPTYDHNDDVSWGAIWMYRATKDKKYLTIAGE